MKLKVYIPFIDSFWSLSTLRSRCHSQRRPKTKKQSLISPTLHHILYCCACLSWVTLGMEV